MVIITNPMGPYSDFNSCMQDQMSKGNDKESASKICGAIKKKAEGKMVDWHYIKYVMPITESFKTEEKSGLKIKGIAINETTTRNNVKYTAEELEKAASSLIGKPLLKDHKAEVDNVIGIVTNATFNSITKNLTFEADIDEEEKAVVRKVEKGYLKNVSVGAYVRDLNKVEGEENVFIAKGIEFVELSLVPVPADPNAGFGLDFALDNARIIKEAYEIGANKMVDEIQEQLVKCPECDKMIPQEEMKQHMIDKHQKKEEKLETPVVEEKVKMVEEIKTTPSIDLTEVFAKLDNIAKEIAQLKEKKVEETVEEKEEEKEEEKKVEEKKVVEQPTKGLIIDNNIPTEKVNKEYDYSKKAGNKFVTSMTNEAFYKKYPALAGN